MTAAFGFAVDNPVKPPVLWVPLLKDAVLAALVAVLLALPLVGLQTYDIGGGALGIRTHFDWVAIGGAAVFAGGSRCGCFSSSIVLGQRAGRGSSHASPPGGIARCCRSLSSGWGLPSPSRSCRSRRAI